MKKFFASALLAAAAVAPAMAVDPVPVPGANRVIISQGENNIKGYIFDRIENITFARVEGPVVAEIGINGVTQESVTVSATRSFDCVSYYLAPVPRTLAKQLSDFAMAEYITSGRISTYFYSRDLVGETIEGMELEPGAQYTMTTVGVDTYGVVCGVKRADFETPALPVTGDPRVEVTVTDFTKDTISLHVVPNSDVSAYYFVIFPEGQMEEQFEQFGPMFGFTNEGQMIMAWGTENRGTIDYTYKDLDPGTNYDLWVQPLDKDGHMAMLQKFEMHTLAIGGTGKAAVTVTPGEYVLADWNGEMKPSQFFTFTPNDQTAAFRFNVVLKSNYDENPQGYKDELCSEPPMPNMAYWWFYDTTTTDYQIDPGVTVMVIAAGKNVNGEWGDITEMEYTTSSTAPTAPAKKIYGSGRSLNKPARPEHKFVPRMGRSAKSLGTVKID